ncbi:MAG TPA: fluoride efflux transporter CrcB [Acidimicrobiales bacterium]|nr:fluoride efflux transporter CrcB [Acidimicrobiales bacterium]
MIIAGLMVAGALGAILRYLVDRTVQRRSGSDFPLGTLVINVTGSLVLGVLVGSALHHGVSTAWLTVCGTGLLGSYTTFSTFSFDTVRLLENGEWAPTAANVAVGLGAGVLAAAAGLALGSLT